MKEELFQHFRIYFKISESFLLNKKNERYNSFEEKPVKRVKKVAKIKTLFLLNKGLYLLINL